MTPCTQCDYENAIRKGRCDYVCPVCNRQLMLELVLMGEIKEIKEA